LTQCGGRINVRSEFAAGEVAHASKEESQRQNQGKTQENPRYESDDRPEDRNGREEAGEKAGSAHRIQKKAKPKTVIKPALRMSARPAPPEEGVGIVTHYFSHLSVATLRLETGRLRVGDTIHFHGHTTDLTQRVESLEVNHAAVLEVGPNDDFGLKVISHVREHDVVYKVQS
jgi:hypothetical protein